MRRRIPRRARWIIDAIGTAVFGLIIAVLVLQPGTLFLIRVLWLLLLVGVLASGFAVVRVLERRSLTSLDFAALIVLGLIVVGDTTSHPATGLRVVLAAVSATGTADLLRQISTLRRRRMTAQLHQARARAMTVTEQPPSVTRTRAAAPVAPSAAVRNRHHVSAPDFHTLLLVASADTARGERLGAALDAASIDAGTSVAEGEIIDAVIALLSLSAAQDPAWAEDAIWWSERPQRVIPIRVGDVPRDAPPEAIRDINFIDWDETDAGLASCVATVFTVLHSDPSRHRLLRGLTAEASDWLRAGSPNEMLISDERRARQQHASFVGPHVHERIDPSTVEFLDRSLQYAERRRRRRFTRRLLISGAIVAAIVGAAAKIVELRNTASAQRLALPVALSSLGRSVPDIHAIQAAAVILQGPQALDGIAREQAREAFAEPWPYAMLGEANGLELNDAALIDHDRQALIVDAGSNLSAWSVPSGQPIWLRRLPAFAWAIDSDQTGSVIVTAGPGKVQIIHGRRGPIRAVSLAKLTAPSGVTLDARGGTAAVFEAGDIFVIDLARARVESERRYSQVLAVARADSGAMHALVIEDHHFAVVDIRTGAILRHGPAVKGGAVGALAADGLAFAYADDRHEVYYEPRRGPTRDLGTHLSEGAWGMAISPTGVLAVEDAAFPPRYLSLKDGTPLQRACGETDGRLTVKFVLTLAVCISEGGVEFETVPRVPEPAHPRPAPIRGVTATAGSFLVVGRQDGTVLLERNGSHKPLAGVRRVVRGAVTAIHVIEPSPTVIVGSAAGDVAEMSFSATRHIGIVAWRWTVPDGSAVVALTGTSHSDSRSIATADGKRWIETACGGCAINDNLLLGHIAYRFHRCVPAPNAKPIVSRAMALLRLTTCTGSRRNRG